MVEHMALSYSTCEAKARFSEILRRVRAGERIVILYRGEQVAEIRPVKKPGNRIGQHLDDLARDGLIVRASTPRKRMRPLAKRRGALTRFLESRD